MAIVQCAECKKDVSSTATTCPHCGAKVQKKKTTADVLIGFASAAILFGGIYLIYSLVSSLIDSTFQRKPQATQADGFYTNAFTDAPIGLVKVLAQYHIRGCGEFVYFTHSTDANLYLVKCNAHLYKINMDRGTLIKQN